MKKGKSTILCAALVIIALLAGCGGGKTEAQAPAEQSGGSQSASQSSGGKSGGDIKIALITMDSIDQHWVTLNEGAQKAAAELGVSVVFLSPNTKDDAQQIECVNNAVSGGYNAIVVAANGPDAISSSLNEAKAAGLKIVYVDSPANVDAEATFSTDNTAAGKTAGEEMRKALEGSGITSGKIGIINVNAATDSTVKREAGFRSAFEGSGFELLETQYGEGDAAKSQSIAENYITQGVVGIFGCNEGSTSGTGNAIKASNGAVIGVGFDKSDTILNLIEDGYLLATMAQNPDVMGYEGVKAAVKAVNGESLGGKVTDTGVSVLRGKGGGNAGVASAERGPWKIALITMDSIDQHWVTLHEGAQKAAVELGVNVQFLSPNTKDDAQQIECVNNAVAGGYDAIIVAANGPDAISSALREAVGAGLKLVYVDSPANINAEATFSTDNTAAGKTAGEELRKALEAAGNSTGKIGIINVNAATDSTVKREAGFRSAFEGSGFEILETQYGEGDAARSQSIAENYITQGVIGIFGANEGSTTGAGNAIKASGGSSVIGVGFDKSDAILNLIEDGFLLCTMAQNPDVMGYEGIKAAVQALEGANLGGKVVDTGVSVLKGPGGGASAAAGKNWKIALITMDSIDQHWVTLHEGAQKAVAELGVTVQFLSPNTKDDAQQIECVNNAVAGGYDAIIVAANGPDAISSALREAVGAGLKLIYVDSPANIDAEATFSTDNTAAGKTAGEELRKALEAAGTTSGKIGIINVNAATDSTVKREAGFRSAFEGSGFEILETQYGEGDAARSQTIAENYITQGVVGIFGANEGSTTGAGNAIKAAGGNAVIGVGFDKSDAILNLIDGGHLLCTMAQNPDVMGYEGVKAAVQALEGVSLGGKVVDTGVSVLTK